MRENLIRALVGGAVGGRFGMDKTKEMVEERYSWLGVIGDVKKRVQRCIIFILERVVQVRT